MSVIPPRRFRTLTVAISSIAIAGLGAALTFVAVANMTSGSRRPLLPVSSPPGATVPTDVPSWVDAEEVSGPAAQLQWAQYVHDTVHGLEKLLEGATAACAPQCNSTSDPESALVAAVRWCGQYGPGLRHDKLDQDGLLDPLLATYTEGCGRLVTASREPGGTRLNERWLTMAAEFDVALEGARRDFREAASRRRGWEILVNESR